MNEHLLCLGMDMGGGHNLGKWEKVTPSFPIMTRTGSYYLDEYNAYYVNGVTRPRNHCYAAKLNQDGTLGSFQYTNSALDLDAHISGCVKIGNRLYLFGGTVTPSHSQVIQYCTITQTGEMGKWTRHSLNLPVSIGRVGICNVGNRVHLFGGETPQGNSDLIYTLDVNGNEISNLRTNPIRLPFTLRMIQAHGFGDSLYLINHFTTNEPFSVIRVKLDADGDILSINELDHPLTNGRRYGISFMIGKYLYVSAGFNSKNTIRTEILPDGTLSDWLDIENDFPIDNLQYVASYNTGKFIYAVCGFHQGDSINDIYRAEIHYT